jgi:gluconate 5-dehydrogenase
MKNLFDLTGKKAIVIGGAGGIGQAISTGLAFYGAEVSIASRNEESLKRAQDEIMESIGKQVRYYIADASKEESVNTLVDNFIADNGSVDILVNSQGFNRKFPATEFPMDVWDELFNVNVKSVMMCCKAFGAKMKQQGSGRILNVSSLRGLRACGGGNTAYGATKGAVDQMTRMLCAELGPDVTVNAIAPTITETPMMKKILTPELVKTLIGNAPISRIGLVEDCIGPAVFLCSDAAAFVTGQIIYPDGGLSAIG